LAGTRGAINNPCSHMLLRCGVFDGKRGQGWRSRVLHPSVATPDRRVATHAPAYGAQVMEWYCTVATINERPCVGPLLRLLWRKASLTSSPSLSEPIEPGSINAMPQWKNRDEVVVAGGGNAIASHAVRPPPRTVTCTYEVRCVLSPRGVTQGCRPRVWTCRAWNKNRW
jgi:hypothetical protein